MHKKAILQKNYICITSILNVLTFIEKKIK